MEVVAVSSMSRREPEESEFDILALLLYRSLENVKSHFPRPYFLKLSIHTLLFNLELSFYVYGFKKNQMNVCLPS